MNTVTGIINTAHLENNSTLGEPSGIKLYGEPLTPSINYSTAYAFKSIESLGEYHEDKYGSVRYTRDSSVLVKQIEEYFDLMTPGFESMLFNSGMSAISSTFSSLLRNGSTVITFGSFYRKTLSIIESYVDKFDVSYIDCTDVNDTKLDDLVLDGDLIIYLESPSNPFLKIIDIDAVRSKFPDAIVILDYTFQGLVNSKNGFEHVDILITSCTKYIGGHNDVLGGVAQFRNSDFFKLVWDERSMRGGIIDNQSAYLLLRSLRTYDLRIEKTIDNVNQVLDFLSDRDEIVEIFYPGAYKNQFQQELFNRMHYHGGGVITFKVEESVDIKTNLSKLKSMKMAPSFGSVDSLIEIPKYMSHWGKPQDKLDILNLDSFTVRLSVGNEPISFIFDDLRVLLGE